MSTCSASDRIVHSLFRPSSQTMVHNSLRLGSHGKDRDFKSHRIDPGHRRQTVDRAKDPGRLRTREPIDNRERLTLAPSMTNSPAATHDYTNCHWKTSRAWHCGNCRECDAPEPNPIACYGDFRLR